MLQLLPPSSYVGLITFGEMATVWELGYTTCGKCYTLRGHRAYTDDEIKDYFGLRDTDVCGRFFVPLSDGEFVLSGLLDELQCDPFPVKVGVRPARCTGSALQIAVGLLASMKSGAAHVGRVMLFIGGVCTKGPGAVASVSKADQIRSQRDIADSLAPMMGPAKEFYVTIERRLIALSFAMDILIGSLDQVGLLEMSDCVNNSGGNVLNTDSFKSREFGESVGRMFRRGMYYNAVIEVQTSRETHVSGLIGPVHNTKKSSFCVSQKSIGHSGSCAWQMSVVDSDTTLALYFDTAVGEHPDATHRFFQFVTSYYTAEGDRIVRVSSHTQPIARTLEAVHYIQSNAFDQECSTVVVARQAVDILAATDNKGDLARRWVDRVIVSLIKRFAQYVPNAPETVRLAPSFSLFPVFMYHLRRSEFFVFFNISPDEMTYKRHYLTREPCDHCLTMIQPTLQMYTCDNPSGAPAALDSTSVQPDNVLVLDTFFEVVVHWGSTIILWKANDFHKNPEYASFAKLLEVPMADAEKMLDRRFPFPHFVETEQHGSQARYLLRYLNPTTTHTSGVQDSRTLANPHAPGVQEIIYTDDASLQKFLVSLKKAVSAVEIK
jgi:protein transport protein SEC23